MPGAFLASFPLRCQDEWFMDLIGMARMKNNSGTEWLRAPLSIALAALVSGCAGLGAPGNEPPDFIRGDIRHEYYDGKTNDLLTGGLGSAGLANANPPPFANPAQPTAAE